MAPARPIALLVTHGALGREMIRTAERILGAQVDVEALSNDGYSSDDLARAIEARLAAYPAGAPVAIFTDLAAGSCSIAARRAGVADREVRRLTGMNLPMLLEFLHYRDTLPFAELLARAEAKGKAGIVSA